jgi:predicted PurR-regulated permease PerM
MERETVSKIVLLLIVVFISAIFFAMIRSFVMVIVLAGIFSAMMRPMYLRFLEWFRNRRIPASLATIFVIVFLVLAPLGFLAGIVTNQAINVGQSVRPWIQEQISNPSMLDDLMLSLPFAEQIHPYREEILRKGGEIVGTVSGYLLNSFQAITLGTVNFLFLTFIFLYTTFFFLIDGIKVLEKVLYYLPLKDRDERRMLNKFTSVTRATLKGTAVIGLVQGGLAGLALWTVGVESALFWSVVMFLLSVVPGIGSALVWGPAALFLAIGGHYGKALFLVAFCGVVVGSADNFLRPMLVGKDTQMHELMILFGTLGGIMLFGIAGIVVGPIIAALFVTVWEIYGIVFRDILPEVGAFGEPGEPKSKEDEEIE